MTDEPIAAYRALLATGALRPDPAQELAVEKLQLLHRRLRHHQPGDRGWRHRLGLAKPAPPPLGLYIFGGVGRGKTMVMDLFHDAAPTESVRRTHFHRFMVDVHGRIHAWRQQMRARRNGRAADPIPPLADALSAEAWLLCFDEFEVRDVADALIMSRLFAALFDRGVVVVATSNRAPDELYQGGLQRDRFLPFIALLKERLDILALEGGHDYRLDGLRDMAVYFTPLNGDSAAALEQCFARLVGHAEAIEESLTVQGRTMTVPVAHGGIARFSFNELCGAALGAADYLAIAARYHTVFLEQIPRMAPEQRNEARRFATLIDVLYEQGVKLLCSADGPPEALYPHGTGAFEFQRTVSRLIEMQTSTYLGQERAA